MCDHGYEQCVEYQRSIHSLQDENKRLRETAKELSDTLLSMRPLAGSEAFRKFDDETFFADPVYFASCIRIDRESLRNARRRSVGVLD
jgi:hypothetical protein